MHETALEILQRASVVGCEIVLPTDAVIAREFKAHAMTALVSAHAIPSDAMMLDVGPETIEKLRAKLPGAEDDRLERSTRGIRDAALRCGDQRAGPCSRRCHTGRHAPERGGRWRYRVGA